MAKKVDTGFLFRHRDQEEPLVMAKKVDTGFLFRHRDQEEPLVMAKKVDTGFLFHHRELKSMDMTFLEVGANQIVGEKR